MIDFVIVGAGIAGLSAAHTLMQQGYRVQVFESHSSLRTSGAGLVLAPNGIEAITTLGLGERILPAANLLTNFQILSHEGERILPISNLIEDYRSYGIHRGELLQRLHEVLPKETVVFGKKAVDINQHKEQVTVYFEDGDTVQGRYLIAADGFHSRMRAKLMPKVKPRYAGYTCWRGVTERVEGLQQLQQATETWGSDGRVGIAPLRDHRYYWFICVNAPKNNATLRTATIFDLYCKLSHYHHPIPSVLLTTKKENVIWSDVYDFVPIRNYAFQRVLLIGDAAHTMTPNMGQGACQALQDVAELGRFIRDSSSPEAAFIAFERQRWRAAAGIVRRSWLLGKVAQFEHRSLRYMRDQLASRLPRMIRRRAIRQFISF